MQNVFDQKDETKFSYTKSENTIVTYIFFIRQLKHENFKLVVFHIDIEVNMFWSEIASLIYNFHFCLMNLDQKKSTRYVYNVYDFFL